MTGELTPQQQRGLAKYLADYAAGVVTEWMRLVDVDEDVLGPGSGSFMTRATHLDDGTFSLGESRYSQEYGVYRLNVTVEPIDVPPVGPENGPAQQEELWRTCEECNSGGHVCLGDGNPIEHGQGDCGQHDDPDTAVPAVLLMEPRESASIEPIVVTAGNADHLLKVAHMLDAVKARGMVEPLEPEPEWVTSQWGFVLSGDRIRLNGQEADVSNSSASEFYANNEDPYRPAFEPHVEVMVSLAHLPGRMLPFPALDEVDILMDRMRKAQLVLQQAFPLAREVR
jgi:hypothetical protein